ncbi:MAG TPA: glycosyltransferase [Patescibacteria group bacterium]|nr:glycosyltransferase [Patescibacteria group bacterium]
MSKAYILSVCIPTYNRAEFLEKSLKLLARMMTADVELVIGDDASTDGTKKIVEEFIRLNKKINVKYIRSNKRLSFDRNVIKIVNSASGKFCWLLGDDDLPKKNCISRIKSVISRYPNTSLVHLNYSCYDNLLHRVVAARMVKEIHKDVLFRSGFEFYFRETKNSYFKYLGTNTITVCSDVINRKRWLAALKETRKFIGYNFIHSFLIAKMIMHPNSVYFISDPQVQYTANNARVWPNSIWEDYNRVLLGYLLKLGYPKVKINEMKKSNRTYIQREAFMKNKYLKYIYAFARPLYYRLRYLKNILSA